MHDLIYLFISCASLLSIRKEIMTLTNASRLSALSGLSTKFSLGTTFGLATVITIFKLLVKKRYSRIEINITRNQFVKSCDRPKMKCSKKKKLKKKTRVNKYLKKQTHSKKRKVKNNRMASALLSLKHVSVKEQKQAIDHLLLIKPSWPTGNDFVNCLPFFNINKSLLCKQKRRLVKRHKKAKNNIDYYNKIVTRKGMNCAIDENNYKKSPPFRESQLYFVLHFFFDGTKDWLVLVPVCKDGSFAGKYSGNPRFKCVILQTNRNWILREAQDYCVIHAVLVAKSTLVATESWDISFRKNRLESTNHSNIFGVKKDSKKRGSKINPDTMIATSFDEWMTTRKRTWKRSYSWNERKCRNRKKYLENVSEIGNDPDIGDNNTKPSMCNWVQCDVCHKWRTVSSKIVYDTLSSNKSKFVCQDINLWSTAQRHHPRITCATPEENWTKGPSNVLDSIDDSSIVEFENYLDSLKKDDGPDSDDEPLAIRYVNRSLHTKYRDGDHYSESDHEPLATRFTNTNHCNDSNDDNLDAESDDHPLASCFTIRSHCNNDDDDDDDDGESDDEPLATRFANKYRYNNSSNKDSDAKSDDEIPLAKILDKKVPRSSLYRTYSHIGASNDSDYVGMLPITTSRRRNERKRKSRKGTPLVDFPLSEATAVSYPVQASLKSSKKPSRAISRGLRRTGVVTSNYKLRRRTRSQYNSLILEK